MRHFAATAILSGLVLLSGGCATTSTRLKFHWPASGPNPDGSAESVAIPSSSRSYDEALARANAMIAGDATLRVGQVAATGSMRPYLGESSLVVLETPDIPNLKAGELLSFLRGGAEYIHILAAITPEGAVVKGSNPNTEELVPFSKITGTAMAVVYFDPATAPRDRSGPTMLLAASGDQVPSTAGTLRVVDATMISGVKAAVIYPLGAGAYKVSLEPDDNLGITIGVPKEPNIPTAQVDINWAASLAGKTVRFQVYHPDAPETGVVLVYATFLGLSK